MPISTQCPGCGKKLTAKNELAGEASGVSRLRPSHRDSRHPPGTACGGNIVVGHATGGCGVSPLPDASVQ